MNTGIKKGKKKAKNRIEKKEKKRAGYLKKRGAKGQRKPEKKIKMLPY